MAKFDVFNRRNIAVLKNRLIPEFIRNEYPEFVSIVEAFLESLDTENLAAPLSDRYGPYALMRRLYKMVDIDETEDEFLELFLQDYLYGVSQDVTDQLDVRLFVKKAKEFFSSKGKLEAYTFLFNMVSSLANIIEPQDYLFKLSSTGHNLSGVETYSGPYVIEGYWNANYVENNVGLGLGYYDKVLRDNVKFTEFAYIIQGTEDPTKTRLLLETLLHPVGMILFIEYSDEIEGLGYYSEIEIPVALVDDALGYVTYFYDSPYHAIFDYTAAAADIIANPVYWHDRDTAHVPGGDWVAKATEVFPYIPETGISYDPFYVPDNADWTKGVIPGSNNFNVYEAKFMSEYGGPLMKFPGQTGFAAFERTQYYYTGSDWDDSTIEIEATPESTDLGFEDRGSGLLLHGNDDINYYEVMVSLINTEAYYNDIKGNLKVTLLKVKAGVPTLQQYTSPSKCSRRVKLNVVRTADTFDVEVSTFDGDWVVTDLNIISWLDPSPVNGGFPGVVLCGDDADPAILRGFNKYNQGTTIDFDGLRPIEYTG